MSSDFPVCAATSASVPQVSVVLPVYNGHRTVERAIKSIQQQTFTNWELVVYDDGSIDATFSICRAIAATDGRIRVIRGETNRGLAAAMNFLVNQTTADLIAVQEQDDKSTPFRLEHQLAYLLSHPDVGLVAGVARWMDGDTEVALFPGLLARSEAYPGNMVEFLLVEQCKVVNASCMFRSRCLPSDREAFDTEAQMSIDWQFFVDVAHRENIHGLDEVLVEMERGPNRDSVTTDKTLQAAEARRFLRIARKRYLRDPSSPIGHSILRRAWATEINLEARWRGGALGFAMAIAALLLYPSSRGIRDSVQDFAKRAATVAHRTFRGRVLR